MTTLISSTQAQEVGARGAIAPIEDPSDHIFEKLFFAFLDGFAFCPHKGR